MTTAQSHRVRRYEERMRADGFIKTHVWIPAEKAAAFEDYVTELRTDFSGVTTPALKRIVANIRRRQHKIADEGVQSLSIFGSYARGTETQKSDLDVVVTYAPGRRLSLLDLSRLRRLLEDAVKLPVDIALRDSLKPGPLAEFQRDEVRVL
jgi:predicted nucleotidyltransferase